MESKLHLPPRKSIPRFLVWYRLIALFYVGMIALTGLETIHLSFFCAVLTYNALMLLFRNEVINKLERMPFLILIDVFFAAIAEVIEGPYGSPYLIYTFSPLFLGGFLFGYRGAALLAAFHSISMLTADYLAGFGPSYIQNFGEHNISFISLIFIMALVTAFLADLLDRLENTNQSKERVGFELEEAMNCLRLSLSTGQLSKREQQVLELAFKGSTIVQISSMLNISVNTVKTYLKRTYDKLDTHSKQQAVSQVLRQDNEIG